MPLIDLLDFLMSLLRRGFLALAAVLAVVCLIDWLVRTRKVSPFSALARFVRTNIDPAIAPVERLVVRAGGVPSSAPWWALVFVVLAGIVVLSVLEFLRSQAEFFVLAITGGPRGVYHLVISWTFAVLQVAIIVRVVMSWIRIRPGSWLARWSFKLSEPILRPLRQLIPVIGTVDITPIVAWFLLGIIESVLLRLW